ncbi:glycosyltransferase family 4 protein [Glaciecola sp. XM2]|uniref:glycosyltransferase family 4 protein n=1 Tax=Glaciecola sp. XM2 TaxID=1914931 RepID=UPI001BDF4373|nr:glycosyltransferase family 4 protein [Glaciecola sp. XM2]
MRIGLIIDTFNIGGAETMVFETAKLLKGNGHKPILLHFGSAYVESFCAHEQIEQHVIPNRRFYKKTLLLPLFAFKTKAFVNALNLDCLHAHLFGPIVAFAPLAWMIKLPFIGTLHDVYMVEGAPHRAALLKLAMFFNAKLVTVSNPMKQFYVKTLKCKEDAITYIPNCTKFNEYLNNRQALREALDLAPQDIAIISVGRLVELKRFDILIDAIAKLPNHEAIKVFIVGDGPQKDKLAQLISQHRLTNTVTMLGERDDVEELLAASDIFSLTSETEGMSKSILEALAANLPVLATNVGGNKDLVIHDQNGYLIEDHQPSSLTDYIKVLIQNAELRQKMGDESRNLVEAEYNSELFLQRHLAIYKQTSEKR